MSIATIWNFSVINPVQSNTPIFYQLFITMLTMHLPVFRTGLSVFNFIFYVAILATPFMSKAAEPNEQDLKIEVGYASNTYELTIGTPNSSGTASLIVRDNTSGTPSPIPVTDTMLFFVILPDGNYIYLSRGNNYQTTHTFQKTSTSPTTYSSNNVEVYAMKKNDPKPPKRAVTTTTPSAISFGGGGSLLASTPQYFSAGEPDIKVNYAWSPSSQGESAASNAYFYTIVSFKNTGSKPMEGNLNLTTCDSAWLRGFKIVGYKAYNLTGSNQWQTNTLGSTTGNLNNISFTGLLPGEVRHIYVQVERIPNTPEPASVSFSASLSLKLAAQNTTITTACNTILTTGGPHDPNKKRVNQGVCKGNYFGTLIYRVSFHNDGNAAVNNVTIEDILPGFLKVGTLATTRSSSNTLKQPIKRELVRVGLQTLSKISFEFNAINLPGLAQTSPRRYAYSETIGWVEFKIRAKCPDFNQRLENMATIFFNGNNPIPTHFTLTRPSDANNLPGWTKNDIIIVDPNPTGGGNGGRNK